MRQFWYYGLQQPESEWERGRERDKGRTFLLPGKTVWKMCKLLTGEMNESVLHAYAYVYSVDDTDVTGACM